MSRSIVFVLAGVALVASLAAAPGDKDGERIKRLVDKAGGRVNSLVDLATAAQSKLIARSAIGQDTLKSIRRYQVDVSGAIYKVALLDVSWRGKTMRLGTSTAPEGHLYRVGVFDEFGKELPEFAPFLAQFSGQEAVGLNEASNEDIGTVIKRRDAILGAKKPPVKPQEKKTWALLKHHHLMWDLGAAFSEVEAAREKGDMLAPSLGLLDTAAGAIDDFSDQLRAVMQPKTLGSYRELLKALRANIAEARGLEEKGDGEGAAKIAKARLKMDCGKCHGADQNEWKKPLEGALREQRHAAGFRPGVFVIDVDLRPLSWTAEEAQSLASAVKASLLAAREE
jgi:hypothetical protein